MARLVCWPDAELINQNGEYLLKESDTGFIFSRFCADNQVDATCIEASRYGTYSTLKALNQQMSELLQ